MIYDNLKNAACYVHAHPGFEKAFAFVEAFLENPFPVGKYEIDGDDCYASVQEYETKTGGMMEAHNKYIDLQFIVSGEEKIFVAGRSELSVMTPYIGETDVEFLGDSDRDVPLILRAGDFAIFFPHDAHKPGQAPSVPKLVSKIVVKIKA